MTKFGSEHSFVSSVVSRKLPERGWGRVAWVVSEVTNPVFIAFPTFLFVAFRTAPDVLHALLWWLVTVVGISLVPFLFILRGVRAGRYTDHHVSVREQRLFPLLFALGCTILV